jgi:hypothetical protein
MLLIAIRALPHSRLDVVGMQSVEKTTVSSLSYLVHR